MNRSFAYLLTTTVLTACGSPEARTVDEEVQDSTMVVATTSRVPSDDRPVVVFLGTSLTAGMGVDRDTEAYPSILAQIADSAGLAFHLVNAGVSGETSAGGLRRLDWALRDPLDVLVIELGANDGLRGQAPDAMADNLTEIITRAQTRYPGLRVLLASMEAPPNLGPVYTEAFRAVFPAVADAHAGVTLMPFILDGVAGVPEFNQSDRIHPNPTGHEHTARNVWPYLRDALVARGEGGA